MHIYIVTSLSAHLLTDAVCFIISATVNITSMNMEVYASFQSSVSFFFQIYTKQLNCWVIW